MSRIPAIGLVTAVALVAAGCGTTPANTAAPSQQDIAGLFGTWNSALQTGDPHKVADLYTPDAVLLPTVSDKVRTKREEIVDYFVKFLAAKPVGTIEQETIKVLDEDNAINTGIYKFTLTKDGKQTEVRARYTYVYERLNGTWLIVNHHSSAMPGQP